MNAQVRKTIASTSMIGYELLTTHVDDFEQMSYTTYGIRVLEEDGVTLLEYPDISTSKEYVQKFIDILKSHDVAVIHIPELLEDYLD